MVLRQINLLRFPLIPDRQPLHLASQRTATGFCCLRLLLAHYFLVVQNGTTANKSSTLSANTGSPTITLSKSTNSNWLVLPSAALGSLSFGINASGLAPGTYTSTVTAAASGYTSAVCNITLQVTGTTLANIKVN